MNMRELHVQEYRDYLKVIQGSIHKILPLYEKKNQHLTEYISDLYDEVEHVLDIIDIMPNGAWYPTTLTGLRLLLKEVVKEDNKKRVKKKVMYLTGLLQKQIELDKE